MANLRKNYLYSLAGQIVLFFVPLILVPYTSRTLGPENLGVYSYTFSVAFVFSTLGRLGISTYGKLQIARNRDDIQQRNTIFCELMTLKLILTVVEVTIYIVLVFAISEYRYVGIIMTIYLAADVLDISWFYEGIENYKLLAVRKFAVNILHLALILMLIRGRDDLYLYALIMQGTTFATNLTLWAGIRKYIVRLRFFLNAHTLHHLQSCFVYFLPTIANLIYNTLDKVMLGFIGASAVESGYYEQCYKIIIVVQTIILQFGVVTLPRLTYLHASGQSKESLIIVRRTQCLSQMLLFPMAAGLYMNAELIVMVVLGESFLGSAGVLRVMSAILMYGSLNYNIGNQILVSTGRQRQYNVGVFAGACVNFMLNLLLIGRYYAFGAAVASLAAEMIIYAIFIAFSKRVVGFETLFPRSGLKYLLATVFMVACNVVLKTYVADMAPVIQLILIITICATIYFVMLLCMREEEVIQTITSMLNNRHV